MPPQLVTITVPSENYSRQERANQGIVDGCLFWLLSDNTSVKICGNRDELTELIDTAKSLLSNWINSRPSDPNFCGTIGLPAHDRYLTGLLITQRAFCNAGTVRGAVEHQTIDGYSRPMS